MTIEEKEPEVLDMTKKRNVQLKNEQMKKTKLVSDDITDVLNFHIHSQTMPVEQILGVIAYTIGAYTSQFDDETKILESQVFDMFASGLLVKIKE
jgi:hypothetical protein